MLKKNCIHWSIYIYCVYIVFIVWYYLGNDLERTGSVDPVTGDCMCNRWKKDKAQLLFVPYLAAHLPHLKTLHWSNKKVGIKMEEILGFLCTCLGDISGPHHQVLGNLIILKPMRMCSCTVLVMSAVPTGKWWKLESIVSSLAVCLLKAATTWPLQQSPSWTLLVPINYFGDTFKAAASSRSHRKEGGVRTGKCKTSLGCWREAKTVSPAHS